MSTSRSYTLSRLKSLSNNLNLQILTHDFTYTSYTVKEVISFPEIMLSLTHINRFRLRDIYDISDLQIPIYSMNIYETIQKLGSHVRFELRMVLGNSLAISQFIVMIAQKFMAIDDQYLVINRFLKNMKPTLGTNYEARLAMLNMSNLACDQRWCKLGVKEIMSPISLSELLKMDTSKLIRKTTCPKVECGPGRYKVYGEISGGYGW